MAQASAFADSEDSITPHGDGVIGTPIGLGWGWISMPDHDHRFKVIPRGGVEEVGRSCYQVAAGGRDYLVDCGLKQGRLAEYPTFQGLSPGQIDAVFITHSHIDHIGALPVAEHDQLLAEDAPIVMTRPANALASILLYDSLQLHKLERAEYDRPQRYTEADVERVLQRVRSVGYERGGIHDLDYEFGDAGHLLGSAWIALEYDGRRVLFSGDLGGRSAHLRDIQSPPDTDALVLESTYGDQLQHRSFANARSALYNAVERAQRQGLPVLIPTFAVGRAQEILQVLREREDDLRRAIDGEPTIVYDGMITDSMPVYEVFCQDAFMNETIINYRLNSHDRSPFTPESARTPETMQERETLLTGDGAPVIVTPSGMLTGGWAPYYLRDLTRQYDNARLVFIGYQAEGTPGRTIQEASGDVAEPRVTALPASEDYDPATDDFEFREETLRVPTAWVRTVDGLSGHAAGNRLMEFAREANPEAISLVHGPPHAAAQLQEHLTANTDAEGIRVAEPLGEITIGEAGRTGTEDALAELRYRQQHLQRELDDLTADIKRLTQQRADDGSDDINE